MQNWYSIGNVKISSITLNKLVKESLKEFDSFDVIAYTAKINENNIIEVFLTIKFKMNLKTYKGIVDLVEKKVFNSIQYFASAKPKIQIRIK